MNKTYPSLNHSIWLEEHDITFVFIPKVACTSWKLFIWQLKQNQIPKTLTYKDIHNRRVIKLPYVNEMSEEKIKIYKKEIQSKKCTISAVIRDPYERILSAYLDKIQFHANKDSIFSKYILTEIQAYFHLTDNTRPSFGQFLEWIMSTKDVEKLNDHWRPYVRLIGSNSYKKDNNFKIKLWTMQNMSEATEWYRKKFKLGINFPDSQFLGKRITYKSNEKIEKYIGIKEKDLIKEIYKEDLDLYNEVRKHEPK